MLIAVENVRIKKGPYPLYNAVEKEGEEKGGGGGGGVGKRGK